MMSRTNNMVDWVILVSLLLFWRCRQTIAFSFDSTILPLKSVPPYYCTTTTTTTSRTLRRTNHYYFFSQSNNIGSSIIWTKVRIRPSSSLWATTTTSSSSTSEDEATTTIAVVPTSRSNDVVNGLLSDLEFRRRQAIHETLIALQVQLPELLTRALTESDAHKSYTTDTKLIVVNHDNDDGGTVINPTIELANTRSEIVAISQALVLAIALASTTADSLLNLASSAVVGSNNNKSSPSIIVNKNKQKQYVVKCNIILPSPEQIMQQSRSTTTTKDNNDVVLAVDWETDLLHILPAGFGSGTAGSGSGTVSDDRSRRKTSSESTATTTSSSGGGGGGSRSFGVKRSKTKDSNKSTYTSAGAGTRSSSSSNTISSSSSRSRISGTSIMTLDHTAKYKVSCHELTNIRWNDNVNIDPVVIGQSLAFIRQTTQTVAKQTVSAMPFLSQATSIWNQVRDEVLLRQSTMLANSGAIERSRAPIYIRVQPSAMGNSSINSTVFVQNEDFPKTINTSERQKARYAKLRNSTKSEEDSTATLVAIDDFNAAMVVKSTMDKCVTHKICSALPGSNKWIDYTTCHRVCQDFVHFGIPYLSGTDEEQSLSTIFAPHAQLVTLDGSVLLQDSDRLDNFYQSIAALRRLSLGKWKLNNVTLLDYWQQPTNSTRVNEKDSTTLIVKIQVDYTTSINVPSVGRVIGSTVLTGNNDSGLSIKGTDVYTLSVPIKKTYPFEEKDDYTDIARSLHFRIQQVEQKKLLLGRASKIRDKTSPNNQQDGVVLMKSLVAAVESGNLRTIDSSTTFVRELIQLITNPTSVTSAVTTLNPSNKLIKQFPVRSDEAAVTIYRIMESLHRDLRRLVDSSSRNNSPPANDYMLENVQLVGYLDEVLVRGRSQYIQSVGLLITSLHAALRSGRIVSEKDPVVQVELTAGGNVRCSISVFLKLTPVALFPDMAIGSGLTDAATYRLPPLNLKLVSEYVLNPETGLIEKQRLLESRVNGQLTPGDVVSRWIQRMMSGLSPSSSSYDAYNVEDETPWISNLLRDAVSWLLSMNK